MTQPRSGNAAMTQPRKCVTAEPTLTRTVSEETSQSFEKAGVPGPEGRLKDKPGLKKLKHLQMEMQDTIPCDEHLATSKIDVALMASRPKTKELQRHAVCTVQTSCYS